MITDFSLVDIRERLQARDLTATQVTQECLDRISARNPVLNAFLHVDAARALELANALDDAGPDPAKPLWGVPLALKDVLCVQGMPCTCGSRMLEGFTPCYDATVAARLREAGAVFLGKLNCDEFAMGSSNESSAYGPARNPWDTDRVPGGSSGGSAAAVAAGLCFGALGTDTGGSIRQPASFCGVVGVKPTYGRCSRYGLVAYGSSLDQPGPMTRSVADAALMLQCIAGPDTRHGGHPKDSTCAPHPVPDWVAHCETARTRDLAGVTIGLPEEYWGEGIDDDVRVPMEAAIDTARSLGATIKRVSLPLTKYAVPTYYIVAMAEASSNLARFDGVRYGRRAEQAEELLHLYTASRTQGFGEEVQRRILLGTYVLSAGYYDAYYRKAAQVRRKLREDFLAALDGCDVLAGPASPVAAWKLGELVDDPLKMYLMDIFTVSLNLAGLPGLCLPVGRGASTGLPVGLQLFGKAFDEASLFRVAAPLEQALGTLPCPNA
ncbi:MAG: Asp-tRNA(Asn)/Glu-tRNA(Gln) amidotransferase subunit GatA [Desulfovibrio sp.]|nr:Asp-tRNA(Asn)/Glu-tRNA(Gln) amidotransferase subunit GatA [Desulfovibrio sp.]